MSISAPCFELIYLTTNVTLRLLENRVELTLVLTNSKAFWHLSVLHVLANNLSIFHVVQSLFFLSIYAFAILCTARNDQLCVEPRLYHYRRSWVLPGLF